MGGEGAFLGSRTEVPCLTPKRCPSPAAEAAECPLPGLGSEQSMCGETQACVVRLSLKISHCQYPGLWRVRRPNLASCVRFPEGASLFL